MLEDKKLVPQTEFSFSQVQILYDLHLPKLFHRRYAFMRKTSMFLFSND